MSRIRTTGIDATANALIQTSTNGGMSWSNYATINMKQSDLECAEMTDEVTPSFNLRRSQGEIIMNGMTSYRSHIIRNGSYGYFVRKSRLSDNVIVSQFAARAINGRYTSEFRYPRTPIPLMGSVARSSELAAFGLTSNSMSSVEQIVLAEALEKASSSDTLALVTLAELDKTADMLVSGARAINGMCSILESLSSTRRRAFNDVLRTLGRVRSKKQALKLVLQSLDTGLRHAASSWLGYRYGVMATIYDVESWINATRSGDKRVRVTSRRVSEYENNGPVEVTSNWNGHVLYGPFVTQQKRKRRTTTTAGVLVGRDAIGALDRFGLNRVASSVWELIPFSFVLDWLVDTGTRISALEGQFYVRPQGSWITHEHNLTYSRSFAWQSSGGSDGTYRYESGGNDSGVVTENCVYRVRIPNPRLSPIPQLNVKMNWKRWADATALLSALSLRFKKSMR